jgi:hypothetical protein
MNVAVVNPLSLLSLLVIALMYDDGAVLGEIK